MIFISDNNLIMIIYIVKIFIKIIIKIKNRKSFVIIKINNKNIILKQVLFKF